MNDNIEPGHNIHPINVLITIKSSYVLEIFVSSQSDIETCLSLLMFGEPCYIQQHKRFLPIT
jgi:hypothetical protein